LILPTKPDLIHDIAVIASSVVTRCVKSISELKASDLGSGTQLSAAESLSVSLMCNGTVLELAVASKSFGAFYFSASVDATKRCFKRPVRDAVAPIGASLGVRDARSMPFLLMEGGGESPVRAYWSIGDDAGEVLGFVPLRAAAACHNVPLAPLLSVEAPALCIAVDVDRNALLPGDALLDELFSKLLVAVGELASAAGREWRLVALPPGVSAAPKTPDEAIKTVRAALGSTPSEQSIVTQVLLERDNVAAARLPAVTVATSGGGRARVDAILVCVSFQDVAGRDGERRQRIEQRAASALAAVQKLVIATRATTAVYSAFLTPRAEELAAVQQPPPQQQRQQEASPDACDTRVLALAVALTLKAHSIEG
jgi:hypothetical protein